MNGETKERETLSSGREDKQEKIKLASTIPLRFKQFCRSLSFLFVLLFHKDSFALSFTTEKHEERGSFGIQHPFS
jgi:hypothetical protein